MTGKTKTNNAPTRPTRKRVREDRKTLRSMLHERDAHIAHLENLQQSTQTSLLRVQAELAEIRSIYKEDMRLYGQKMAALEREKSAVEVELAQLSRDTNTEALLAEYASVMKKPKGRIINSSLETVLCKALHSVEVLSSQLKTAKKCHETNLRLREEDIAKIVTENKESEAQLTDQILTLQKEKSSLENTYESDIRHQQMCIETLEGTIEEMKESSNRGTNCNFCDSRAQGSHGDLEIALKATKDQLDSVAQEKDVLAKDLGQRLKNRDGIIASLEDIIESKEQVFGNQVGGVQQIVDKMALVTGAVENSIMKSLLRKKKLLEALDNEPCASSTSMAKREDSFRRKRLSSSRVPSRKCIPRDGCSVLAEC